MKRPSLLLLMFTVLMLAIQAVASLAVADEGNPVAIRRWPGGGITIETMWNLHLGNRITDTNKKLLPREVDLHLYLATVNKPRETVTFGRSPNDDQPSRRDGESQRQDENDVVVSCEKLGPFTKSTAVQVDGLTIRILDRDIAKQVKASLSADSNAALPNADNPSNTVFVLDEVFDQATILKIATTFKPRLIIVPSTVAQVGDHKVESIPHNTLAFSATAGNNEEAPTRFVSLSDQPYKLSPELTKLFKKKETACRASRETFAKLSIEQMNFQPSNGTHTPRWNSEHMMGRELLFFSQIFHAVDPSIPVMDLNPRQMPKDYKMAHPDWTGAEEARQTERVEAFTRRYAYLLDGMDLDRKAKGSKFWTPRKLLKQMERHYNEHTANVDKKMQLNEWPK